MQSNAARALVALAGIAVIVVAFIVISGSDDSDDGGSESTVATTTTTGGDTGGSGNGTAQQPSEPSAERLEVVGGQPADGAAAELTYSQGDEVAIVIDSDIATEFHLHGYDIEEPAAPGEPARFDFTADLEGKFELEDHHTGALIAELTVNP